MPHICFTIRFTIRSIIGGKMIQIEHLYKTYSSGKTKHEALKDINLTIESGEVFGILGSSGAGKSSLVRCINLLERPTSGKVVIDGKDITDAKNRDLSNIRSNIGMIFQNFSLFQQRTVLQNVTFPLELNHTNKNEREERAKYLLDLVGLKDLANRYPIQLSGGQQQRVAIARALANNPSIMLCDEATSALDSTTTAQILDLLRRINRDLNVTLVIITHSLAVARNICDRVAMIDGGKIVEIGDTSTLFKNPQSNILKTLIANENVENHRDNSKNISNSTNNSDNNSDNNRENSENSEVK